MIGISLESFGFNFLIGVDKILSKRHNNNISSIYGAFDILRNIDVIIDISRSKGKLFNGNICINEDISYLRYYDEILFWIINLEIMFILVLFYGCSAYHFRNLLKTEWTELFSFSFFLFF
jgi:hypothetical protein